MSQKKHLSEENLPIAEINIIPFVDIILVLLIIFMVTTPFLIKTGFSLQLPTASKAQKITASKINIIIEANGRILLNNKEVSLNQLTQTLKNNKFSTDSHVVVSADKNILHGKVIAIINALQGVGLKKIAIATSSTRATNKTKQSPATPANKTK